MPALRVQNMRGASVTAGRPTKYSRDQVERVYESLAQGNSVTQFAAQQGVARSTVYKWAEEHEEFSVALSRGQEAGQAYWEGELQKMMYSRDVNAPLVKLYFANRFGWHEGKENKDEGNAKPANITFQVIEKTDDSDPAT